MGVGRCVQILAKLNLETKSEEREGLSFSRAQVVSPKHSWTMTPPKNNFFFEDEIGRVVKIYLKL